jgi:diguanylate cyclase (GGDEF)-like protein/PAS domain S-box-containing protein
MSGSYLAPEIGPIAETLGMRPVAMQPANESACPLALALAQIDRATASPLGAIPGAAMFVTDAELRILGAAGRGWEEVGRDPATLAGVLLSQVTQQATWERLSAELNRVLAGEQRAFSLPLAMGSVFWLTAQPLTGPSGHVEGTIVVGWDQTRGSHAEERYRLLAENATEVVTRHDLEGRYLYASPSIETTLGWRPEDVLGRPVRELIHPDDIETVWHEHGLAVTEGGIASVQYRMLDAAGGYRWMETSSRALATREGEAPDEIQCSSRDITERREAQEELARRLAQQSAVARLGELALQRPDMDALQAEACRLVAETLDVDMTFVLEHVRGTWMRVRAGVGWPDGFVGSELEVRSFGGAVPGSRYADGALVIDDLPSNQQLRGRPLRANGVVSLAMVLIGEHDKPVGLLGAHTRQTRQFRSEDVDFLNAVAHVLAGALERVRVEEQIRHDALHDALTGLPNRTLLLDRLERALARAKRDGTRVAVLFLDLDRLKLLNDSIGHSAGDDLLRAVGPRLQPLLRDSDTVARFGGDEFAVVLQGVDGDDCAMRVAERIVRAFERPFLVAGSSRMSSASVGVVVTDPAIPRTAAELLSDADAAMYRCKEHGRGGFELFDAGLRASITDRLQLEDDLRRALDGEPGLWVAFQPYFSLPACELAGVEALVRWDHPTRGPIGPSEFVPIAEDSGLINELGARVLRAACTHVARLRALPGAAGLRLTVNVSARQFVSRDLVDTVAGALEASGLPASQLGLEITEGLLLEESPATVAIIESLRRLGVPLILDDFGTGYSSLRYLQRYPLNALKIDRSFVDGLGEDGLGDGAIVEAVVAMARALGMRVVPEGVETRGQLERLVAMGCDFAQGFFLSRPLTPDDLEALVHAGGRPRWEGRS